VGRTAGLSLPLVALSAGSLVGTALAPALLISHPMLVVALAPRAVFLVVAADRVDVVILLLVAAVRLMIADPFHYALGRLHGERVAEWIGQRFPGARLVHDLLIQLLHRAGAPAIALSPTGKMLLVAGAMRMPAARVAVADIAGTVTYLVLVLGAGRTLDGTALVAVALGLVMAIVCVRLASAVRSALGAVGPAVEVACAHA
jgi:membrane protein DedA with SNARE-associated domain